MKVTVLLQGGLGNQLFQIAWMHYLRNHRDLNVHVDMNIFFQQKQHNSISFSSLLGDFISFPIAKDSIVISDDNYFAKVMRYGLRKLHVRSIPNSLLFDYDALTPWEYCVKSSLLPYHYGYFQFVDAALISKDIFLSCIKDKHSDLYQEFESKFSDCVGIHIRRGDFLTSNNSLHIPTQLDYIKNAIREFGDRDYVVFSDDINWCKTQLKGTSNNIEYFSGSSAIEDFIGLMCCKDYILSGSTFSWWAAFINANSGTVVICPHSPAQFMSVASNQKIGWDYAEIQ